jgi:hypothetical protein
MSWLTVELLLTVTRGGEDRHVLLLTFCIYKQSGILLKREMPTTWVPPSPRVRCLLACLLTYLLTMPTTLRT